MKRRIRLRRRDGVRQRYWKNYGSVVLGKNLPAQLHMGAEKIIPWEGRPKFESQRLSFFKPTSTINKMSPKPLWTSTYTPKKGEVTTESDWVQWSRWNMPGKMSDQGVVVRPLKNARIFQIHDENDIKDLVKKYADAKDQFGITQLNWSRVAKDYDALRVTEHAAGKFHLDDVKIPWIPHHYFEDKPERVSLNPWDAESTVWFRPVFRKQVPKEITTKSTEMGEME